MTNADYEDLRDVAERWCALLRRDPRSMEVRDTLRKLLVEGALRGDERRAAQDALVAASRAREGRPPLPYRLAPDACPSREEGAEWVWAADPARAHDADQTIGKWLVFRSLASVDGLWTGVGGATAAGELGPRAKASTLVHPKPGTVICVYYCAGEAQRVLDRLRDLGIWQRLAAKSNRATLAGRYGAGAAD